MRVCSGHEVGMSGRAGIIRYTRIRREGLACYGRCGGDPGRIRTCDPQIRNLMLYPAELRGRSADCLDFGVRSNPTRRQATRKLEQRLLRCNAQCAEEMPPREEALSLHFTIQSRLSRRASVPFQLRRQEWAEGRVWTGGSKPLLVGRIRDRELFMLAMVETGCVARFETRRSCASGRFRTFREGGAE